MSINVRQTIWNGSISALTDRLDIVVGKEAFKDQVSKKKLHCMRSF
jgi:hypothetical protein